MEKTNKYYSIIENLVKQHKKFPGYEDILDDIIDDVYSHSEVIINSINNESVIKAYLEKVISTSIITVPKKLNIRPEPSNRMSSASEILLEQKEKKDVNTDYVDRMINGIENSSPVILEEPLTTVDNHSENIEIIEQANDEIISDIEPNQVEEPDITEPEPEEDFSNIDDLVVEAEANEVEPMNLVDSTELSEEDISPEAPNNIGEPLDFANSAELLEEEISVETPSDNSELQETNLDKYLEIENSVEEVVPDEETTDALELVSPEETSEDEAENVIMPDDVENLIVEENTDLIEPEENTELVEENNVVIDTFEDLTPASNDEFESEDVLEPEGDIPESLELVQDDNELELSAPPIEDLDDNDMLNPDLSEDTGDFLQLDDELETETLEPVLDNDVDLALSDNDDEFSEEASSQASPIDYSAFNYVPEIDEKDIDIEGITEELIELNHKRADLNILKVYELKYKENCSVSEIALQLEMSEDRVIETLSEIIAIVV